MTHTRAVGDRIERTWAGVVRRGVVTEVYWGAEGCTGGRVPLYTIRWDDTGYVERGYIDLRLVSE